MSKVYGLAGLRLGWATAASDIGAEIIEQMVNYKRYLTISNSSLCERIAIDVLADCESQAARYRSALEAGRTLLDDFAKANGDVVSLVPPNATPFAWFNLTSAVSSRELAKQLLDKKGVLIMPAEVFGSTGGFRLTYARPRETLAEGLHRLSVMLKDIHI